MEGIVIVVFLILLARHVAGSLHPNLLESTMNTDQTQWRSGSSVVGFRIQSPAGPSRDTINSIIDWGNQQ